MTLNEQPAATLARKLAARDITCEALARACLERVQARESEVLAWAHFDAASVLRVAREFDRAAPEGLLWGLPIGVKDVIDTADVPTSYGSPIYAGHRPAADAACVAMARKAGAYVFGKSATTEFATAFPAATRHPLDPRRTPGGSSSGSAAAVADCMVPLAFGTQTGGSTLRPASFCGIVGYKPTFGMINRTGVKPVADALDTLGLFARTVEDVALLAAAAAGRAELAVLAAVSAPKIGLWHGTEWVHAQPESAAAVEQAAQLLARVGSRVAEVDAPAEFAGLGDAHHDIEYFEMARGFAWERTHHAARLSPVFISRLERGSECSLDRYHAAFALAERCRRQFDALMEHCDVLLTAAAPGEAPLGLGSTGSAAFNSRWTLLHAPSIALPGFKAPSGMPVGVQLIGPRRGDRRLLAVAEFAFRLFH